MKTLPNGITGFWVLGKDSLPETDISLIKKLLFDISYNELFLETNIIKSKNDTNYFIIEILYDNESHKIAINSIFPFYSGLKEQVEEGLISFYDLPSKITNIIPSYFKKLKSSFLNKLVTTDLLLNLNSAEIKQINYWKAKKVGNIIFNNYD